MLTKLTKVVILAASPLLLAACNASSGSNTGATAATPATTVATQSTGTGTSSPGPFPPTITGGDGFQANPVNDASFSTLINSVRTTAGTTPVTYNAKLDIAAQGHANDMLANNYFSHTGLNGSTPGSRVTAAGYNWSHVGENIARGQQNENQAMNGWVGSPSHQANNVNPNFKEFGLGRAGSGASTHWVLILAAPSP
ncbi:MAG: CAP domain-containing protein [Pikeienuella sp.]